MVFIFLLVSIICSALREAIEARRKSRAAFLEHGIRELLHDRLGEGLARDMYLHPLVSGLYGGTYTRGARADQPTLLAKGGGLPSYIPTRNFALALMDMAARGTVTDEVSGHPDAPAVTLENMRRNVTGLGNAAVQRVVLTAIDAADGDLVAAQGAIERWYESSMDRVSGWYKRSTSWVIFWIGLGVALTLNVNVITVADYLYRNNDARQALVARAQAAVADSQFTHRSMEEASSALDAAHLPLGWSKGWGAPRPRSERTQMEVWSDIVAPVLGLLLTALAATFGAPFWFDLLNKMMVVRSTVKPHEKSKEESSEDRQSPKDQKLDATSKRVDPFVLDVRGPVLEDLPTRLEDTRTPVQPLARNITTRPPSPRDKMSGEDTCDVEMEGPSVQNLLTLDEDLPPAEGGVE
ncbi:MAG: hypothetical protein ABI141_11975 [Gemmatimonadaceae bacterium]